MKAKHQANPSHDDMTQQFRKCWKELKNPAILYNIRLELKSCLLSAEIIYMLWKDWEIMSYFEKTQLLNYI